MGRGRLKKYDTFSTGLLSGFILPLGIFILIYLVRYRHVPLSNFIETLLDMKILIRLLSLCVFVNLLGFLLFYRNKMDKAARGMITATFIYAFLVLISRIV